MKQILIDGFNGIVDIMVEEDQKMLKDKLKDGLKLKVGSNVN